MKYKTFIGIVVLAVAYLCSAKFGLFFALNFDQISIIWPSSGLALAAILILGFRYWVGILIGAFLANLFNNEPWFVALSIGLGNTLEALFGAYLLKRMVGFRNSMDRVIDILGFIIFAVLLSSGVGAVIGATSLYLGGLISVHDIVSAWLIWWTGDMMGILTVAPLVLVLWNNKTKIKAHHLFEGMGICLLTVCLGLVIFTGSLLGILPKHSVEYFLFVPIIWSVLRFGQVGAVITVFLSSSAAILGTYLKSEFSNQGLLETDLIFLQVFIMIVSLTAYFMGAIVSQTRRTSRMLKEKIQERTHSFEALSTSKRMLEAQARKDDAIIFNIGDGLVVISQVGIIELVNHKMEEMTGYSREEMLGQEWDEILKFSREDNQEVELEDTPIQQVFSRRERIVTTPIITESTRFFIKRKDGKRIPVQINISPILIDGRISGVVAVFRDVSREIEIEKTKTEFVAIASHQLRTPLSTVNWYSEMLLSGDVGVVSDKQRDYIYEILHGNQRMIDLVDSLLNVSRLEMGVFLVQPTMVNLIEVVKDVIEELRPQISQKKIAVNEKYSRDLPLVQTDYSLTRIVLQNLITNAIKYTKDKIEISISKEEMHGGPNHNREGILIKIHDNGLGIPDAQSGYIFTKMFRADNAREKVPEGTGLGLYIVKSIMDQTGGKIWFESKQDVETCFYVLVPVGWMTRRSGMRKLV